MVLAVAGTGLAAALAVGPAHLGDLAWRWLLLFLGLLGAALGVGWLRGLGRAPAPPPRPRRRQPPGLPADLLAVQDAVRSGTSSRADFERVLRPILAEIAEDRLLALGLSPQRQPDAARERAGPAVADLVLGPRRAVYGTREPGPGREALAQLVEALEGLRR